MSGSKPIRRETTSSGCSLKLRVPSILLATYSALLGSYLAIAVQGDPINEPN